MRTSGDRRGQLKIEAAGLTYRGRRRKLNEDAVFHQTETTETGQSAGLYLVCDGLGGRRAGEVASQLAIETVTAALGPALAALQAPGCQLPDWDRQLRAAIGAANAAIHRYGQDHGWVGASPATTLTLALVWGSRVRIANVGDSRTYAWRAGQLTQITRDHSWAAKLVRLGAIEPGEKAQHTPSHLLTRAMGLKDSLKVDFFDWTLQPGDRLLLCSDGLWQAFPEPAELAIWLGARVRPVELCWRLVTLANRRDGSDNISAVLVRVEGQRPAMDECLTNYLRTWRIDSFQKLHCLLFLYRHPQMSGTTQEFGQQLYFGDTRQLREIMTALQQAGLVERGESGYRLRDEAEVRSGMQGLAQAFEDPLTRQALLDQIRRGVGAPIRE